MNKRKLTALILAAVMTATMTVPSMASGPEISAVVSSKLESTASRLASLTPGEDYVDGEGVFLADTEEEAKTVAKQYGAVLKRYAHGVAVIQFSGSTVEAFNNTASVSGATRYVDPNYICHATDAGIIPVPDQDGENDLPLALSEGPGVKTDIPNDKYANSSESAYQYFHDKVNTLAAHDITTGKGAKIAVIDTGCTPDHEDSKFDPDHVQYIEYAQTVNGGIDERVGHGIHCTGIIHEEKGNTLGGYGIAPDAEIYSIQIAVRQEFSMNNAVEGIQIAIDDKVDVISMSIGGYEPMESLDEIVDRAYKSGITMVAAAGNDCTNARSYPGACDHVICVAASDIADTLASYSNYGDWVDIVAPGTDITSTYIYGSGKMVEGTKPQDTYGCISGTSMATPIVAGIAALCYASNPAFSAAKNSSAPDAIEKILLETVSEQTFTYGDHSVSGLVQADKAVSMAKDYSLGAAGRNYSMVDQSGTYGSYLFNKIARGKSVKLEIGDINGNTGKEIKKQIKSTTWTSSNPGAVSVKNGKVKCNKKAAIGTKATITAKIGQEEVKCDFEVTEPIISAGYCTYKTTHKGKIKLKVQNSRNFTATVGQSLNLKFPQQTSFYLVYSKDQTRLKDGTGLHALDDYYSYRIDIPKKAEKSLNIEYAKNGRPLKATFISAGQVNIKVTPLDGSGKSLTYKIKVS